MYLLNAVFMKPLLKISLLFLLQILYIPAFTQQNWSLKKDKNGIKIYTAGIDSSKFKMVKVECEFDGNFQKLISIMKDVDNHKDWVYATKKSYTLKKINDDEIIYYLETSLPWPMNNRDAIIDLRVEEDTTKNLLTITTTALPHYIADKKGIIRIPSLVASYNVNATAANKIHIVYYLRVDPGGNAPAWVVNLFADKGPYETFKSLADLLKRTGN